MESVLSSAILSVQKSDISFSKYITANDTGATGGHQAGFHIHKNSWLLFFDSPGEKGSNKDRFVTIKWQNSFETTSRFIYYGCGTRNEYRLTRFGKGFPFISDENVGDLLIITQKSNEYYEAFVLQRDEDIDDFFTAFNLSSSDTNGIIPKQIELSAADVLLNCFNIYVKSLEIEFPSTLDLAKNSRSCYNAAFNIDEKLIQLHPDKFILDWVTAEFQLFKTIENNRYTKRILTPFKTVEELISIANTLLNRRKSRAGKSLELHLAEIFKINNLMFTAQGVTEDNKKPDFLFPSIENYFNPNFDSNKLIVLASKTTCKDRWRQILNEADRIKTKHLFTLQQGISKNQLTEMYNHNVNLVVPKKYISSFPPEFRSRILTLETFVSLVKSNES